MTCSSSSSLQRSRASDAPTAPSRASLIKNATLQFKGIHSGSPVASPDEGGKTIGDICTAFPKRNEKLSPATIAKYEAPIRVFQEFFSPGKALASLKFEDGERLVAFLSAVPTNATKRYPGIPLRDAAKLESKDSSPAYLSPKSQHDAFNSIRAMLNYAVERQWLIRNPFQGRALADQLPENKSSSPKAFSPEDLNKMFTSPRFLSERARRGPTGERHEGRFWLPLLCLFHGMRQNEAASLLFTDVKSEDGIHFLDIKDTNESGNRVKRLKTAASKRRIPIHKELIQIGFLDFVSDQIDADTEGFLFPEMTPNAATGSRAKKNSVSGSQDCAMMPSVNYLATRRRPFTAFAMP